ncbi:MAG: AGE family epimerase/isomerase, partial [Chloroflexota bacterium]
QERFHEDWSHDKQWSWQQDRAVVGHNLKIAWNLMRINALRPKPEYVALARQIADVMPDVGCDRQRGGWYDVMERRLKPGRAKHSFVWHDRKAWWQQEQAILAYLILAGELKEETYLKLARESSAFHNAYFLDSDEGGIFFNVLANGMPYQTGTERLKGSHSMGGYHSTELCYLAAVYTNLLITRQPLDLYFKPQPKAFPDRLLRVQPDILPAGSVVIGEVWINGEVHQDFDAAAMTIKMPDVEGPLQIKVRLLPIEPATRASIDLSVADGVARLVLEGDIVDEGVEAFRDQMVAAVALKPSRLVLNMGAVKSFSATAVRAVIFARQKIGADVEIYVIGATPAIKHEFELADFAEDVVFADRFPS